MSLSLHDIHPSDLTSKPVGLRLVYSHESGSGDPRPPELEETKQVQMVQEGDYIVMVDEVEWDLPRDRKRFSRRESWMIHGLTIITDKGALDFPLSAPKVVNQGDNARFRPRSVTAGPLNRAWVEARGIVPTPDFNISIDDASIEKIINGLEVVELQRRRVVSDTVSRTYCEACPKGQSQRASVMLHGRKLCRSHAADELAEA